jgi:choline dehydrogenase-like flavoprotein
MMIKGLQGLDGSTQDICVVGAGPVGIALALELARRGRSVLLLESGDLRATPEAQLLSEAEILDTRVHVPMDVAVHRGLGGASNLWGGRCVPLEPIDFEARTVVPNSGWPIGMQDLAPYLPQACAYIGCGEPIFENSISGVTFSDGDFRFDQVERWSRQPRFDVMYARVLRENPRIDLRICATVTGLAFGSDGRVAAVQVRDPDNTSASFKARAIVLAAGGLESTRLLLASRMTDPGRFGGEDGPLGRYYMGHLYGIAAEMVLGNPAVDAGIDYFRGPDGHYLRRRFTPSAELQRRAGLSNTSFWPDYPLIRDAAHRNGIMSLAYLALSIPPLGRAIITESIRQNYVGNEVRRWPHIVNLLRDLPRTAIFMPSFLYHRYLVSHPKPGFFQRDPRRKYAVRFHAEHLPSPESRVKLSNRSDAYGMPRLLIDMRYSNADVEPLIRAHDCFADWLQRTGTGTMQWLVPNEERANTILSQCYDGHHQMGTTRMADDPRSGVVDSNCRVFDSANLFVAGSSVFPTSGEANPTLNAVALGLRLAELLASEASMVTP